MRCTQQPLQLSSECSESGRLYNQCVCLLYQCEQMLRLLRAGERAKQSMVSPQLRANPCEDFCLLERLRINLRQLAMKPSNLFGDVFDKLRRKCGIAHKSRCAASMPNI